MAEIKVKPRLHASWIDPNAKEIVRVLQKEGFQTYLVGGCVRDLLAGFHPKDYDIATNAEPNQVKRKIWGSYVIGKRFRLVLVKRGDIQYEVATFRREANAEDLEVNQVPVDTALPEEPMHLDSNNEQHDERKQTPKPQSLDNFFGTAEQDAIRRDFTVNALFYDPIKDELIDYCNGVKDIETQTLRVIGDPATRIKEDPIRSLRAIRLSHKIKFKIEASMREAIQKNAAELLRSALPRRREEYLKLLRLPDPIPAFAEIYDLGLMQVILPSLVPIFEDATRREIFMSYIHRFSEIVQDPNSSIELYTLFTLAFERALSDHPDYTTIHGRFVRDELMMFKAEQGIVEAALALLPQLEGVDYFKRRGYRRQQAFLKNEALPLALRVAKADHILGPAALNFWEQQMDSKTKSTTNSQQP